MPFSRLIRTPSAFVPILMSFAALTLVTSHLLLTGITHEVDEGTPAHLFQLLIALQVPIVGYHAFRWLPASPTAAIRVLTVQLLAVMAAFAPVSYYNL